MRKLTTCIALVVLLPAAGPRARAEVPPTSPAPLVVAADETRARLVFQIGADAMGGLGGMDFIAGVNASLLFPVADLFWVGIRPSLHYGFPDDSVYEVTWFHPEVAFHINILHHPVRLYFLGAGGYAFALDSDLYDGVADGWSALAGVGVAWRPGGGHWGLFAEAGYRLAFGSQKQEQLVLDDQGKPRCDGEDCLYYLTETADRQFELNTLMFNLGVIFRP